MKEKTFKMLNLTVALFCLSVLGIGAYVTEPNDGECTRFSYEYRIMENLINLKNENARLSEKIAALEKKEMKTPIIASHVRLSQTTPISGTDKIMYDVEISNIGEAFDMKTSQFIVPISGLYLIRLTVCLVNGGPWVDLNIVKDSSVIGRAFAGDSSYHSCGSEALTVLLEAGQNVWVERAGGIASSLNEEHGWNTFTVALLHAE